MNHTPGLRSFAPILVGFLLCIAAGESLARDPGKLPNVVILATGGTIAGTGATSTTTVGYTAATVPVDRLIDPVPELKKVPNLKGEQAMRIPSEKLNTDRCLKPANPATTLPPPTD